MAVGRGLLFAGKLETTRASPPELQDSPRIQKCNSTKGSPFRTGEDTGLEGV